MASLASMAADEECQGVCASSPPVTLVRAGRTYLTGTPYELAEAAGALARGEALPGLTREQQRLVEAYAERAAAEL